MIELVSLTGGEDLFFDVLDPLLSEPLPERQNRQNRVFVILGQKIVIF